MSPNEISSNFDKILIFSSSESSDSESLLQEDIKSSENKINKQWEAIERTLYQEPGEQVTDPELLKECKLWRETFPHFRVKGTKVDLKLPESEALETEKNTQTLKKHFDLRKLEEKRESIKSKVVGMLVDRLVTKYSFTNANPGVKKNGLKITEIDADEKPSSVSPKNNLIKSVKNLESPNRTEKESYFERGKTATKGSDYEVGYNSKEQEEKCLQEIFDSWEKDCKSASKLPKSYLKSDPKKPTVATVRDGSNAKPCPPIPKPKKIIPSYESNEMAKPFEMKKKIDKKYDGLIERIMERRYNEMGKARHCPTSASGVELKSYQESLEKLRVEDGFNDCMKRNTMPRINKFRNNWLERREINRHYDEEDLLTKKSHKPSRHSNYNLYNENDLVKTDEKILEELKKDVKLNYKRPAKKTGLIEEINLQRPKPLKPVEKPSKSSSSGDVQRKTKKETKSRRLRNGSEICKNELNSRHRAKSNNPSKKGNINANQSTILPPIECGLICTELTGRPKIGPRIPGKRPLKN